jgi:hypothetical protein
MFASSGRKYDVYFNYPWSEEDEITINLPAGYKLDNADSPPPFSSGEFSAYTPSIASLDGGKALLFKRAFFFGGKSAIIFPVSGYDRIKAYFDALHKSDSHTITLKQAATTAPSE